ncbi:MAG: 4-demethylwyosine synthase TYW1, partial [Candidatus Hodarchaeales archaeon]
MSIVPEKLITLLHKQKYQLYGNNTSVKKCAWTHNALRFSKYCYKRFYGIKSHRCIQFSPTLICNFSCQFCWRIHESDIGLRNMFHDFDSKDENKMKDIFDSPREVVKGILLSQRKIICGYKPFIDPQKYKEAMNPKHATLSLTGEPFLYPWIPELIQEIKKENMTVFIVTNGSVPSSIHSILEERNYPTQLYVTLPAPGIKNFLRTHRPIERELALKRILNTLEIIGKGVPFRTVARLTVAKGLNLTDPVGYAKMIETMKPSFIEIKGVVHVGATEKRLPRSAMPSHEDIHIFAKEIENLTNFKISKESDISRLVILSGRRDPLIIP